MLHTVLRNGKNKNVICRPRSVRIGKNCALGLEHGPRPTASGRTQDLGHSFSLYGPPGRQITYISFRRLSEGVVSFISVTFLCKLARSYGISVIFSTFIRSWYVRKC